MGVNKHKYVGNRIANCRVLRIPNHNHTSDVCNIWIANPIWCHIDYNWCGKG